MGTLPPTIFILFFGLVTMAAGALLAWLVLSLVGNRPSAEKGEKPLPVESFPIVTEPEGEELLSVRRVDGEVAVFVGGRRYRRLEDIKDPHLGKGAVEALKAVMSFAAGWLPLRREPPPAGETPVAVEEEKFIEQLERVGPAHSPDFKPPAEAIDDLIQQRLRKWPDLVGEKVRMSTAADGTLRIHVGLQVFRRVDDVPDPRARALIRDAIREWERGG